MNTTKYDLGVRSAFDFAVSIIWLCIDVASASLQCATELLNANMELPLPLAVFVKQR